MRILVIGDIHGHLGALDTLLNEVVPTKSDIVVFLGDYVDKGPNVKATLGRLIEFSVNDQWVFLRGNHDQMFLDACLDSSMITLWECLAGHEPLASYGVGNVENVIPLVPISHIDFLKNRCVDYYEDNSYIYVHGGIRPHMGADESIDRLHWMTLSDAITHQSGKTVICGHSSQKSGMIADLGHTICVDTAISNGRFLTCLNLTDFSWIQASEEGEIRKGNLRKN